MSDEGEVATPETAEADVEAEATALTTPWAIIPIKDETSKHEFIFLLPSLRKSQHRDERNKSHVYRS